MARVRIIPVLLLKNGGLYKTINFKNPAYIGDPINTVKLFNEKEADELLLLDYNASLEKRGPDFSKIAEIAGEAFMPMGYGGGIQSYDDAKKVFDSGYEKIVLNSVLFSDLPLIEKVAGVYGSQAVVGCIDVKRSLLSGVKAYAYSGSQKTAYTPLQWAKEIEGAGVGEIMINSIDKEGTWNGYDLTLVSEVANTIQVPVIACGGAGTHDDFRLAVKAGASGVAAGSLFVFQKKGMGVLISFPSDLHILK